MEIAVAVGGGLLGALLGYLIQNYLAMVSEDSAHLNDHIAEIRCIEEFAVGYWLCDATKDEVESDSLEARLEGAISASASFNGDAPRLLGRHYLSYVDLDQMIYDAATGGTFKTANRLPDYQRVVTIMSYCSEMRSLLRRARRSQYWAH